MPAYNQGKKFHPPESEWLGYVFTIDGVTFYHSGDTDYFEAMKQIRCDVAFLPCEGHYTMGPADAVRAAEACGAEIVIPIHWGGPVGTRADAESVKELFEGEVVILERGLPS